MKKRIFAFLAIFVVLFVSIVPVFAVINVYDVTFNPNGGTMSTTTLEEVDCLTGIYSFPYVPTKSGYTFEGWYYNSGLTDRAYETDTLSSNVTLYAKWTTGGSYTITFNSNGGSSISSYTGTNIPSNVHTASSYKPTKSGYTFDGWYTNSSLTTLATAGSALTGNITLYAKWLHNYTITFNPNGGSSISSYTGAKIPSNVHTASAYKPTKSGYTFDGWYTNSSLTTRATAGATLTGNITLYAKWVSNGYTITFNPNGGSFISSYTGTNIPSDINTFSDYRPIRTGYTFVGWYTDSSLTTPVSAGATLTGNITLYAKYGVSICWWNTDLSTMDTVSIYDIGHVLTSSDLSVPSYHGYGGFYFLGWYYDNSFTNEAHVGDVLSFSIDLFPKVCNGYNLSIYVDDFNTPVTTFFVPSGYALTSNDFAVLEALGNDSGYQFEGVYYNSSYTVSASIGDTITDNTALYVKRVSSVSSYTITFNSNGGSSIASYTGTTVPNVYGSPYLPSYRSGYTFEGWCLDEYLTIDAYSIIGSSLSSNITLYAKWSRVYTVTFNSNGGSGFANYVGTYLMLGSYVPSKSGYTFIGWFYNSACTERASNGDVLSSDITLYAKWAQNASTITFDSNGGSAIAPYTGYYVPSFLDSDTDYIPIREGYIFDGWYCNSSLTISVQYVIDTYGESFPIDGDVTFYAKWSPILFTVTFNSMGGNSLPSIEVDVLPYLQNSVRYGYEFCGWFYDSAFSNRAEEGDFISSDVTLYAKWNYNYIPPADGEKTVRDLLNGMTESVLTTYLTVTSQIGFGGITVLTVITTAMSVLVIYLVLKIARK